MSTEPRCYVIGLGNIGAAIATRLVETGAEVIGVDLDAGAQKRFRDETGRPAVADWSEYPPTDGDRVIVLVRTTAQANETLGRLGETGVGLVVFVMTTLELAAAQALARRHAPNLRVVEMPVSGGRQGALDGTLTALTAGPLNDVDREFLRTHIATTLVEFANYGQPTAAKLYNNVLAAYHARAHAEVVLSAAANGLDIARLSQVLDSSSGASWMGTHLAVVVDDLLEKDVALFEQSFGAPPPVKVGAGSDLAATLAAARNHLATRTLQRY